MNDSSTTQKEKSRLKRIVAISDLHSGHVAGLTPPGYRSPAAHKTARAIQAELWSYYSRTLDALQPIHALLVLGDCIDGKGDRSGGTEQITSDLQEQCDMAAFAIKAAKAKSVVMVHGTPYHVGPEGEDYERIIAREVGATIGGHEWAECYGVVFDLKHKVGSSSTDHGRHTAIAREKTWNELWALRNGAPRADIILRGHVHYFRHCGGPGWLAMTMPALQGFGSKYGTRQCSGIVDVGLVSFDLYPGGKYSWEPHVMPVRAARPIPVKL